MFTKAPVGWHFWRFCANDALIRFRRQWCPPRVTMTPTRGPKGPHQSKSTLLCECALMRVSARSHETFKVNIFRFSTPTPAASRRPARLAPVLRRTDVVVDSVASCAVACNMFGFARAHKSFGESKSEQKRAETFRRRIEPRTKRVLFVWLVSMSTGFWGAEGAACGVEVSVNVVYLVADRFAPVTTIIH